MPHPDKSDSNNLFPQTPRGEIFDVDIPSNSPLKKWRKGLTGLGLLAVPLGLYAAYTFGAAANQSSKTPVPVGPFPSVKVEATKPVVNVTGQVKKPGVYTLAADARIQDAIQKAGGALPNADLNALNLAAWVEDGSKIVVPAKQVQARTIPTPVVIVQQIPAETPPPRMGAPYEPAPPLVHNQPPVVNNIPAPVPDTAVSVNPAPASSAVAPDQASTNANGGLPREKTKSGATSSNISPAYLLSNPLDINSATQFQLEGLPDIGPKTAERIVAYRTANGRFGSVEELDNVKGIGEKTLSKLKPYIVAR